MAGRNRALSEYVIIADLMRGAKRHGSALDVQLPVPRKDTFTVASTPATTYTLSALPISPSINLSLNGVELIEGVDYTVNYTTAIVTVSATLKGTPTPADVLTADYWTTGDLIALSGATDVGAVIADTFNRADSSSTPNPASDGGTWTQDGNVWGISSNQGYATNTLASSALTWASLPAIRRDTGVTAFDIQADNHRINTLFSGSPISGLFGAADPTAAGGHRHGYGLLIGSGGGAVTIQIAQLLDASIGAGVSTTVSDWLGSTVTFRLTHDGTGNLKAYMGGSVILTYTDTSGFGPLGTWVGALDHPLSGATIFDAWDNFQALSS